jgi:AraC family transcriptional regulator
MSDCGTPLVIEESSINLEWKGVHLEKGHSPYFYPKNIYTESFYFALSISASSNWKIYTETSSEDIIAEPGEVWLNPPYVPFTHEVNTPCFFILLLIEEQEMYKNFEDRLPQENLNFLTRYNVNDVSLSNMIQLFYNEVRNSGKNGKKYFDNLKKLFSSYFIRNYSDYTDHYSNKPQSNLSESKIQSIHNYILDHITEDISIDDLSFQVGFSKFYFLREFKKFTGITPYQFILKLKLERAQELLRLTNKSLTEIAYELCFSDQSHLNRAFTKLFGETPKKYKSNFLH